VALLDLFLALLTAGVAFASTLPLLAKFWWVFDLFTHFRLQYLSLLTVLLALHAARRRWRWAVVVLPFAMLSAFFVFSDWTGSEVSDTGTPQLSIVTVNVQAENNNVAPLLEQLQRDAPDMVLVVEYNSAWQQGLRPLAERYPYRVEAPQPDRFGMALLSRLPLEDVETFDLLTSTTISARAEFSGRSVRVFGVHLRPPVSASSTAARDQQLEELGRLLADRSEPLIVTGDFNVTTYSPVFSEWLTENRLRDAGRLTISWPTFLPLLGILIDHCVVSEDFIINDFSRGPAFGSDHYPVTATVSLRGA